MSKSPSANIPFTIGSWIAFDLEWEPAPISRVKNTVPHSYVQQIPSATSEPPELEKYQRITTFAYEDSNGNRRVIDIADFASYQNPQQEFLLVIKSKLLLYDYCFGWGSKAIKYKNETTGQMEGIEGDLVVLDSNFRFNGIQSIIRHDKFTGLPYIKSSSHYGPATDIDLLLVFAKPIVKYVIFKNRYKSLHLNDVSRALLSYGKLASGKDIMSMSVAERKEYCLQDAHIVANLVMINNGNIMKIMQVISKHTGLKLNEVCHKGMTAIWNKILNDSISKKISLIGYNTIPSVLHKLYSNNQSYLYYRDTDEDFSNPEEVEEDDLEKDEKEQHYYNETEGTFEQEPIQHRYRKSSTSNPKQVFLKYKGAVVLEPRRGLHHDAHLFDVTSLYPTIIVKYNLSPETVNCSCCKDNDQARQMFTPEILTDCKYAEEGHYWICQRRKGLFAKILDELTEERIKYKKAGLEIESQAIKAIINSGYGVFGHPYFKYYDPRVAELVTALGRHTLAQMRAIAESLGFIVLYGDTDSLFVNNIQSIENAVNKFIAECKSKLRVDVELDKIFGKLILVGKKHYIGIPSDPSKEPVIKGMEGIKSDRPEFIQRAFKQLVDDIKNDVNPIPKLKESLLQLDNRRVSPELLAISLVLRKNPEEYDQVCKQSRLGTKLGLRKGDTFVYYKCNMIQANFDPVNKQEISRTVHESDNLQDISYAEYKEMFINSIKDILQILGYDTEKDLLLIDRTQLLNNKHLDDIEPVTTITSSETSNSSVTTEQKSKKQQAVSDGIDIILSLFTAVEQQRLFPRTIMTKLTKGQIRVHSKEEISHYFEMAEYQDCRINTYPAFVSEAEEQDYKRGINMNLFAPNILFIDLDAKTFKSSKELERALKDILKHIAYLLQDIKPLVLWSGHGYHIIIPVNCKQALECFNEYKQYYNNNNTVEPSKDFLQFAARHLSLNKSDSANNPSFKSCLLRVPYTFNSKCIEERIDAEVKIVQAWNTSPPPSIDNLLVEFQTFLVDKKLKAEIKQEKLKSRSKDATSNQINSNIVTWIERLFEIAIEHNREFCVWRIFAPYLINIRKLEYKHSYDMIKGWLDRCDSKSKLDFDADYQIKYTLKSAISSGYLPISFDSLKIHNPDLYKLISFASTKRSTFGLNKI